MKGSEGFGGEPCRQIASGLEKNRGLVSLKIQEKLSDSGVRLLAAALKTNKTLTELELFTLCLGHEGSKGIAEMLEENRSLLSLAVYQYNKPRDEEDLLPIRDTDQNLGEQLQAPLTHNTTLRTLILSSSYAEARPLVDHRGALAILSSLVVNNTLAVLNLNGSEMDPEKGEIQRLGQAIKKNYGLTALHLDYNHLGNEGAKYLAKGVAANHSLQTLSCFSCDIGKKGMKLLAKAVLSSRSLCNVLLHQKAEKEKEADVSNPYRTQFDALVAKNKKVQQRLSVNWMRLAPVMCFVRANSDSGSGSSSSSRSNSGGTRLDLISSLMPTILGHISDAQPSSKYVDSFAKTQFYSNEIIPPLTEEELANGKKKKSKKEKEKEKKKKEKEKEKKKDKEDKEKPKRKKSKDEDEDEEPEKGKDKKKGAKRRRSRD